MIGVCLGISGLLGFSQPTLLQGADLASTPWTTPTGQVIFDLGAQETAQESETILESSNDSLRPAQTFKSSSKTKTTEVTLSAQDQNEPSLLLVQGTQVQPGQLTTADFDTSQAPESTGDGNWIAQPLTNSQPQNNSDPVEKIPAQTEILDTDRINPDEILQGDLPNISEETIQLPDGSVFTPDENPNNPLSPNPLTKPQPAAPQTDQPAAPSHNPRPTVSSSTPALPNQFDQDPNSPKKLLSTTQEIAPEKPSPFGNLGQSPAFQQRLEDGSMVGNPYSHQGAEEFHPTQFYGTQQQISNRHTTPPIQAYGRDMWGNPCVDQCGSHCCGAFWRIRSALQNTQASVGVLAFRNPLDVANTGNFGADLGLNWVTPQKSLFGLAFQSGGRATLTSLNGYYDTNGFDSNKQRTQLFWTSGLFYRSPETPWQFGFVYDSLNDSYYRKYTLGQIRAEVSRQWDETTDIGFRGAFHVHEDLVNFWRVSTNSYIKNEAVASSYYTGFVRKYFQNGGDGMIYGGVTEWGEGLVGGQMELPINDYTSLKNSFSYVFAKERGMGVKSLEQTWNVSATLTIYLGGNSRSTFRNPLKPLFDVADNGTFLQNYKR